MGATGALRFARLATEAVVALVPQIDLRDFEYAGRADFTPERKARRVSAIPNLDPNPNPHPNPNPNPNQLSYMSSTGRYCSSDPC